MFQKIAKLVRAGGRNRRKHNRANVRGGQDDLRIGRVVRKVKADDVTCADSEAPKKIYCLMNCFQELSKRPTRDLAIWRFVGEPAAIRLFPGMRVKNGIECAT